MPTGSLWQRRVRTLAHDIARPRHGDFHTGRTPACSMETPPSAGKNRPMTPRSRHTSPHSGRRRRGAGAQREARQTIISARGDASERALILRAKAGGPRDREELVSWFAPMIASVARRYRRSAIDREELTQEGVVGLLRALERFEPERGVPFLGGTRCGGCVRRCSRSSASCRRPISPLRPSATSTRAHQGRPAPVRAGASPRAKLLGAGPTCRTAPLADREPDPRRAQHPRTRRARGPASAAKAPAWRSCSPTFPPRMRMTASTSASWPERFPDLLAHLDERERTIIRSRYGLGRPRRRSARSRPSSASVPSVSARSSTTRSRSCTGSSPASGRSARRCSYPYGRRDTLSSSASSSSPSTADETSSSDSSTSWRSAER